MSCSFRIMFHVKNVSLHMTHISQRLCLHGRELSGILSYLFPRQGQDKVSFPGHVSRKSVVRAWHFGYLREMSLHVLFPLHPRTSATYKWIIYDSVKNITGIFLTNCCRVFIRRLLLLLIKNKQSKKTFLHVLSLLFSLLLWTPPDDV